MSISNNIINKSRSAKNNLNNLLIRKSSIYNNKINSNNIYIYKKQNQNNSHKNTKNHIHKISLSSPFCLTCGSIYKYESLSLKIFSSIKPNYLFYKSEISILKIISNLRNLCNIEKNNFIINSNFKLTQSLISIRKKTVNKMKNYIKKSKYSNSCLFLSVFFFDYIILNERINLIHKLEQIAIGCIILGIKFIENINYICNLKHLQYLYEGASSFSREQLKKFEINSLLKLNYHLQKISFYEIIHFFLINGILFNSDLNNNNNKKINFKVYFLVLQICDIIIENDINYCHFNQFELACAVISFARKLCKYKNIWPEILMELYKIKFEEFEEQFIFVENLYINKTQIVNSNTKRNISYNSSLGKINLKNNGVGNSFFYSINSKDKKYLNNKINNNNCSNNKYIQNQKLFKNYKRLMSQSMDMTRETNNFYSLRGYSSNKKHNNSLVNNKNTLSNINIKSINSNRTNSIKGNSKNKNKKSNLKKNLNIYYSQSLDKRDSSFNLSYRSNTEVCNLKKMKIDDYRTKLNKNLKNKNEMNNSINKKQKSLNQEEKIIKNKSLLQRNNNSNNKNNLIQKKDNKSNASLKFLRQNIYLNLMLKNNYNDNIINDNQKLNKRKIDIIEELTMNKLRKLSKNKEQKQKKKRKISQINHINITNNNNYGSNKNNTNYNNNHNNKNKSIMLNKYGRNLSVFIPNKSTNSAFVY